MSSGCFAAVRLVSACVVGVGRSVSQLFRFMPNCSLCLPLGCWQSNELSATCSWSWISFCVCRYILQSCTYSSSKGEETSETHDDDFTASNTTYSPSLTGIMYTSISMSIHATSLAFLYFHFLSFTVQHKRRYLDILTLLHIITANIQNNDHKSNNLQCVFPQSSVRPLFI